MRQRAESRGYELRLQNANPGARIEVITLHQ